MCLRYAYRFDSVEISFENSINYPAKLRFILYEEETELQFVLVQFYELEKYVMDDPEDPRKKKDSYFHPVLRVPRCKLMSATNIEAYQLFEVSAITGHAHMVRDFDSNDSFWWDLVNQEWLTYD